MGKRGSRSKRRPSVHERRAHKHAESEEYHKRRARIISNSIIVAAIWTVANILAYGYSEGSTNVLADYQLEIE